MDRRHLTSSRKLAPAHGGVAAVVALVALAVGVAIALPAARRGRPERRRAERQDRLGPVAGAEPRRRDRRQRRRSSPPPAPQAAAAAAREAELSAVLAQGQEREAELEVRVQRDRGAARQGSSPPAPRPRGARGPPGGDLQGRRARTRPSCCSTRRLRRPGQPRRASRPDRGGRRGARRSRAPAPQPGRGAARRGEAGSGRRRSPSTSGSPPPATQIAGVRATAEAQAAQLEQARAEQAAALSSLRSQVASWEQQVQQAQQVSAAQAQQTVSSWFGDWAIPQAIVMCESGGNFGAVNPSSGAGGAYQILPSTWRLYGGRGAPQDASPQQQSADRLADLGRLRVERLGLRSVAAPRVRCSSATARASGRLEPAPAGRSGGRRPRQHGLRRVARGHRPARPRQSARESATTATASTASTPAPATAKLVRGLKMRRHRAPDHESQPRHRRGRGTPAARSREPDSRRGSAAGRRSSGRPTGCRCRPLPRPTRRRRRSRVGAAPVAR